MNAYVILLSAVLTIAAAESPAVTGVYFVAPPPPPPSPPQLNLEKINEEVMAQLKQIEGSNSGEYHVYLPDGRLQKVTYTTAPLPGLVPSAGQEQLSQYRHKPAIPSNNLSFQNNQQVNHQVVSGFNQQNSQSNQVKGRLVAQEPQQNVQPQPAKYVASISYTDVQPITGPVYAHNEQPLTRILRYAPSFA